VSKDDSEDLGSSGGNPLDEDLLGAMGPAPPAGGSLLDEEMAGLSPGIAREPLPEAAEEKGEGKAEEGEGEPEEERPGFLARLAESNPYTVMLVASLVALLIGICCLLLEWGSYGFDTKAKASQESASTAAVSERSGGAAIDRQIG